MTIILGLNVGHPDASACLVIDGILVGAVAEERLGSRIKHDSQFPKNAIAWLFQNFNLSLDDISHVAISRDAKTNILQKLQGVISSPQHAALKIRNFSKRNTEITNIRMLIAESVNEPIQRSRYVIHNVEHHIAHIASSYFTSGFDKAKALSFDGSGDYVSIMLAECEGNNISVKSKTYLPDSLGHFYSSLCQFIGFTKFGEEYKVMGLAPYGNDIYTEELKKTISVTNGRVRLNRKFIDVSKASWQTSVNNMHQSSPILYTESMYDLFGTPRSPSDPISQREKDIAKSTQSIFEEAAHRILQGFLLSGDNFVQAGGCSLNGVNNAKLINNFNIDNYYLHSAAADDGTAVGAAYYVWNSILKKPERFHMKHAFWGPDHSENTIKSLLKHYAKQDRFEISKFDSETSLVNSAAKDINENLVIGWYQGASEWGPRALGNRSILANPMHREMKAIINSKIKKRESFRPFAPSVLAEDVKQYFKQDIYSPFMMHVVEFKEEYQNMFPSVTHVDGTGRLQSVSKENNALYHALISSVKKLTGHGIVLNTSFNENEPVVDTPEQAFNCFERTDMDVLYLKNYRITKNGKKENSPLC